MNEPGEEMDPRLMQAFEQLMKVPKRDPEIAAAGKQRFLAEAEMLKPAVSPPANRRHIGWIKLFNRKEPNKMTTLTALFFIVTLFLGGTGATVAAARDSLPDQPLYAVKLASEDIRAGLTVQQQNRVDLALAFADQRVQEALRLAAQGDPLPEMLLNRLAQEYQNAFQLAAGMDEAGTQQELLRIRAQLEAQMALLDQIPANAQAAQSIARLRSMLAERLRLLEQGLSDPQAFREQLRKGSVPQPSATPTPVKATGTGKGNPWTTGTPTPGSGYGPGPGPDPTRTCTPESRSGAGPVPTDMPHHMTSEPMHTSDPGHSGSGPMMTQPANTAIPSNQNPGGAGPGPMPSHEPGRDGSSSRGGGGMHH